jgi:PAS domain S-box-containing protein
LNAATPTKPFSSIRARLSLVLILALIPAVLFLVLDAWAIQRRARAETEAELLRLSQLTAVSYQQRLDEAQRIMAAIALFPEVRTGDAAACSARLAQMVELYQPHYPNFGVADLNGEVFCTAIPLTSTVQVGDRSWFQEPIRTGDFTVGEFTVGRRSGNLVLSLGLPILDESGQVVRVLGHGLQLTSLQEQAAGLPLPDDTVLIIADHNGTILARVPDGERWAGQLFPAAGFQQMQAAGKGFIQTVGVDGVKRLYAFTPITGPGSGQVWLSLGQTSEAIYAEVNQAVTRDALGIAAILLVALAAVWLGSNRLLLRKIDRLVAASERLAEGDLAARLPAAGGDELDQLGLTFNQMAEALQQREAERKLTELRLQLLAQVAEMVRQISEADAFLLAVAVAVGEHLQVQRSLFVEIDLEHDLGRIQHDYHQGVPSIAGEYRLSAYSLEAAAALNAGQTVVNRDSQADPRTAALYETVYAPDGERAYVAVPLMRDGQRAAVFWVSTDVPRDWRTEEVSLLETVAERAWIAVEKLQGEAALRESEQKFSLLFEKAAFGAALSKLPEGILVDVNEAFVTMFGYTRQEAVGKTSLQLGLNPDAEMRASVTAELLQHGSVYNREMTLYTKSGEARAFLNNISVIEFGGQKYALTTTQDITERKQAEKAVRESEARFRNMANIVPSMVWTADPDGTITFANDEWFRYVGITPEQNARGWPELVLHPDDYERCLTAWTHALQSGTDYEIEVRNRRHDGEYRWFLTRARPTRDEAGQITAWFGITTDIHERKRAERRGHFLAEATRALAASLDMNHTLQEVARLAVPDLADWCTLNLLQPDGSITLAAAAHHQPEQEARLWALAERYPLQPEAADGTPHVIRSGKPELHHFNGEGPEWARESGVCSLLIVPLKSYGRTFGALSLACTESGRHFDQDDLALAEEVARRAALAMENAELYQAEQQAREQLEVRVRERTAELEHLSGQLRELMARLQTAREEEQTRLSRELHDQLGGALTILKMDIFQIQRQLTDSKQQAELEQLMAMVDETIDLTRQLSRELRPAVLDYLGLAAALEWQLQEFEKRAGIRGRLLADEMEKKVDGEVATAVFRIVQEALTNVARHAQASEVNIRLQQDAEYLLLEVRDNGRGIRLEEVTQRKSLGLLGMRERVRLFAGEVAIDGVLGEGTAVRVKIPLQDHKD